MLKHWSIVAHPSGMRGTDPGGFDAPSATIDTDTPLARESCRTHTVVHQPIVSGEAHNEIFCFSLLSSERVVAGNGNDCRICRCWPGRTSSTRFYDQWRARNRILVGKGMRGA